MRRLVTSALLAAMLGGAVLGAVPVIANAAPDLSAAPGYPPPDPYAPEPYDEETPGAYAPVEFAASSLKVTGTVGTALSTRLTLTADYDTSVTFTVVDPSKLPPGITIATNGTITGTPTSAGTFAVPVKACVLQDCTTATITFTIKQSPSSTWKPVVTYTAVVGRPSSGTITVTGTPPGVPITYVVTDPSKLPPGITISASGQITGTPTKAGTYTFPVKVCAGSTCRTFPITITVSSRKTQLEILVEDFSGVLNRPATGHITANGVPDGATVTYSVIDPGKLPPGIKISASGVITGTPTKAGTYVVPIRVCMGTGCATTTITLTISSTTQMLIVLTGFSGYVGQQVSGRFILEGAEQATFTVLDASKLPPGVKLAADGTLSGVASAKGAFTFPVKICVGTACGNTTLTITILADRPTYGTVTTTEVTVVLWAGQDTTIQLPTDYGRNFTVADTSNLPPGITITSGGVIKGRPTTPGMHHVLLKVDDETWKVTFVVSGKTHSELTYEGSLEASL